MNERSFVFNFKESFEKAGWEYMKIADRSTVGIPDCFVSKQKFGAFLEMKMLNPSERPTHFERWSIIGTGPQMTRMLRLERSFNAFYVLGFKFPEVVPVQACLVSPALLYAHLTQKSPLPLPPLCGKQGIIDRLNQFLPA